MNTVFDLLAEISFGLASMGWAIYACMIMFKESIANSALFWIIAILFMICSEVRGTKGEAKE